MPLSLLQWYSKLGIDINEGYGMTKTLAVSAYHRAWQESAAGPSGPGLMKVWTTAPIRYWRNPDAQFRTDAGLLQEPEQSRDAFTADGWLRTGDKGRIDAQGCLHITGP